MKFTVLIHQHLVGSVTIHAESQKQAIERADMIYNKGGAELPDMDDGYPLQFEALEVKEDK